MTDVQGWADRAMFPAAPLPKENRDQAGNIIPRVHLLWMTPDPLGAVAAMARMYKGVPTYHFSQITDDERYQYWHDVMNTHLRAPLESIKLHFFIEGVTRSFTHQMVRQRTAVYAQESLRFAVKEDLANDCVLPPSIADLPRDDPARIFWDQTLKQVQTGYDNLISLGIPAEDARGLMPHAVATRLNYITDLRNMAEHAGNRLCTQAQFEWRMVFTEMVRAIREYPSQTDSRDWQFRLIAGSELFRPVCYQRGHCPFNASFDRGCTIKGRVELNAQHGVPSNEWHQPHDHIGAINPGEWLLDHTAARYGGAGHD